VKKKDLQKINGIDEDTPLFTISVVSRILGIHTQTLRIYDREGLVCPERTSSNRRLYSEKNIKRLEYVCHLVHERGVNISGAKIILELLDHQITEEEEGDEHDTK
jgi:MerR family transcriptional regulator/heat shock protein HspR